MKITLAIFLQLIKNMLELMPTDPIAQALDSGDIQSLRDYASIVSYFVPVHFVVTTLEYWSVAMIFAFIFFFIKDKLSN